MFALLDVNVDFGELLRTQLSLQLSLDAQGYVEGKATRWCRWYPRDRVVHLLVFHIHSDYNEVLVDNRQFFKCMRKFWIPDRANDIVRLLLEVVCITFLGIREGRCFQCHSFSYFCNCFLQM